MPNSPLLRALKSLLPGDGRILWHAAQSECQAMIDAFQAEPEAAAGLIFAGLYVPGMNSTDFSALTSTTRMESVFSSPAHQKALKAGRMDFLPMHYSNYPGFLERNPADLAILHLPPPRHGIYSCGPTADIAENIRRYAKKIMVVVNPQLPFTHGGCALRVEEAEAVIECDAPLRMFPSEQGDASTDRIAHHVASLIRDGDTIQCGIGRVMANILRALKNHRRLCIRSGMLIDEIADLAASGTLASAIRDQPAVIAGITAGTEKLFDFIRDESVHFHGNTVTHNALHIAKYPGFTAINSAISVDLSGQVNCENVNGRQISGIGGGGDFLRAARLAPEGRAIIALPATSRQQSRIVARLDAGAASTARADADIIVTEYGIAHLRDLTLDKRAEALMAIAAPEYRDALAEEWRVIRNAM